MLKKLTIYVLILAGLGMLFISTSETMMQKISEVRNESDAWWGIHNSSDKGDLVNMAYLDYVEKFHSNRDYQFSRTEYAGPSKVNLYLHGDSYTFKIPHDAFDGVNRYEYAWVYNQHIQYTLDSTKKNILILEHAERYLSTFYGGLDLLRLVYSAERGSTYDSMIAATAYKTTLPNLGDSTLLAKAFNKNINQNIEYNLFNYNLLNAPRLGKAMLNYYLFNRASGEVVISETGDQLFIKESVAADNIMSSQYPIGREEYSNLVSNLNLLYKHYRAEGFDEVYLAAIPNPATILEPEGYNMLIPRLQRDTSMHMKCIDIYSVYKKTNEKIYRPGDSHWYNSGMQLWIGVVNDTLRRWNKQAADSLEHPPAQ